MFRRLLQVVWVTCVSLGLTACGDAAPKSTEAEPDGEVPLHSERGGVGVLEQELGAGVSLNARRSLAVTETAILSQFTLQEVLDQLVRQNGTTGYTSAQLFRQLWETQNRSPRPETMDLDPTPRCSDNGFSLNGFEYLCREDSEGEQAWNGLTTAVSYSAVGLFNRFDLAPSNGADCGEYRIVFAKTDFSVSGRSMLIFEAVLPNPRTDLGLEGCRPVTNFWRDLSTNTNVDSRATALKNFYFNGLSGFSPVIHYNNYGNNSRGVGQVRTNQFVRPPWLMREFKVKRTCPSTGCKVQFVPATVKTNPYGELFNPNSTHPLAAEFRSYFLTQVKTLAVNNLHTFNYVVPDKYNVGQNDSQTSSVVDNYNSQFRGGSASTFRSNIQAQLTSIGSSLTPEDIVQRAEMLSCGGCHQRSLALQVGSEFLHPSHDFTHSTEFTETGPEGERFRVSSAVELNFLPRREQVLESFLNKTRTIASSRLGLEYIAANKGNVYWTEQLNPGNVMKNAVGGSPVALATGLHDFWGIATDGVNVYWMDTMSTSNTRRVMKIPVNGGTMTTLAARENMAYLATDGANVYWIETRVDSNLNFINSLMKLPVGGGTPVTVANMGAQSQYLAVDSTNVYWRRNDTLVKMPKAGGTITTLVTNVPFAVSLASDGTHLYWAENDWATPGGIKKVPVVGGSPVTVLSNVMYVTGVAVDNYSVYWTDGSNPGPVKTGPK
ncbi:MAG TPA: hypothetical protein VF794_25085 [Archangium sp.]|uniref:hypothetical protein n=1 Tax=Archangium sp. TaxID=1872627 RepID=UPI002EDB29A1